MDWLLIQIFCKLIIRSEFSVFYQVVCCYFLFLRRIFKLWFVSFSNAFSLRYCMVTKLSWNVYRLVRNATVGKALSKVPMFSCENACSVWINWGCFYFQICDFWSLNFFEMTVFISCPVNVALAGYKCRKVDVFSALFIKHIYLIIWGLVMWNDRNQFLSFPLYPKCVIIVHCCYKRMKYYFACLR